MNFAELRENPRFLPELGTWEGWFTPLKWAWKTHAVRIDCEPYGPVWITWEPGDWLRITFNDGSSHTLSLFWEFELIEKMLKECDVKFVRKEEIGNV